MSLPPYAKLRVSVNGGPPQTGALTCSGGDTIDFSAESTVAWSTLPRWELYGYPPGYTAPSGWSTDANGVIFSTANPPPQITLPAVATRWGKWLPRLIVNQSSIDSDTGAGTPVQSLVDSSTAFQTKSPSGLADLADGEDVQFAKDWTVDHRKNLRLVDAGIANAGTQGAGTTLGVQSADLITYPIPDNSVVDVTTTFVAGDPAQPTKAWRQDRTITVARTGGGAPVADAADAGATVRGTLTGASAANVISGNNLIARGTGSNGGQTLNWTASLQPRVLGIIPAAGPTLSAYADVASFAALLPNLTGTIAADTDSVTGQAIERYTVGAYRTANAGVFDFASQGPTSFVLVWRQSLYASTADHILLDTTANGTHAGVQIIARDNYPSSTAGRQLIGRVFDGSTWIVDYTTHGPVGGYQALIWSVAVITITATSLSIYVDGLNWITITFSAITFPPGAASAAKIGNGPFDLLAFEVWQGGLSVLAALAATARLQSRFSLTYKPVLLWTDPNWGESDPAGCTLSDNTYVALATKYPGPGSNIGHIESRTSADGITWSPAPGSDGSGAGNILPFTILTSGGVFDPTVVQLSNGSVIATANQTAAGGTLGNGFVKTLKAANAAAVRSNTWTNETSLTPGTATVLELLTSELTEDPANPGTVYALTYRQTGSETFPSVMLYKSTDYAATWAAPVKVLDGVADSTYWAEAGLKFVTTAAAAKYSDLTAGTFFIFARDDNHNTMAEVTSATGLVGSFTKRATNLLAHSAARFRFLQDGTMVPLIRDNSTQYNTIYRRTGVSGGIAQYTANPVAPSIIPTFGNVVSGNNIGQYGNICAEVTPGILQIVTANRLGLALCSTYARQWPEWQLYGQMPIVVSPSSVPTKNAGDTVQFTARGAGGYVWSLATNAASSTINSSTGLYTAGNSGPGTDVIRCTDQNGYFDTSKDVSVGVNAGAGALPDLSNLVYHFDAGVGANVTASGGLASSVANSNGTSSALTEATGGLQPGYGTTTLNSLHTLDYAGGKVMNTILPPGSGAVAFSDFTRIVVFKMAALTGLQTLAGNSSAGYVLRIDSGVLRAIDYADASTTVIFTDLTVLANTAHVAVLRRTGTSIECWLDGVKSTVTGTCGTNAIAVTESVGSDLSGSASEAFLGQIGEIAMWKVSESSGNITTASATLKTKWGTT